MMHAPLVAFALAALVGDAFTDLAHDAALAAAREQDRLLLIDFTAASCEPCARMSRTTWVDDRIVAWVREHAIAIQVDIDEQPEIAARYGIKAGKAVVALRDGDTIDDIFGNQTADELLTWLEIVREGRFMRRGDAGWNADYGSFTFELIRGDDDEALEWYLRIWKREPLVEPGLGVLVRRYPPARAAFLRIYAETQVAVEDGVASPTDWRAWFELGVPLGLRDEQLAWIETQLDDDGRLHGAPSSVIHGVATELEGRGRLADAGRVYPDPVQTARELASAVGSMRLSEAIGGRDPGLPPDWGLKRFRHLHEVVAAAKRTDEAAGVAELFMIAFPGAEVTLEIVRRALDYDVVTPSCETWLLDVIAEGDEASGREARDLLARVRER